MKLILFFMSVFLIISENTLGQINQMTDLFGEYSKDISVSKGKKFLIDNLLKSNSSVKKLEIYALSAAISGELTTLIYQSEMDNQEGLLLGFYGNYWNDSGVVHQGYGFKNFDTEKALEFLYTIKTNLENNKDYLRNNENKNLYFLYDDITIMATGNVVNGFNLRVFWKNFDSLWEAGSFNRTIKRFEKRLDKLNK